MPAERMLDPGTVSGLIPKCCRAEAAEVLLLADGCQEPTVRALVFV